MVFQNPDNQIVATVVEEDVAFALENLGVIKINNLDEKKYQDYDSVVLLGELTGKDAKIKFDQKEKIILNKLKENNKYLVAANQSESDNTILKLYSENNISINVFFSTHLTAPFSPINKINSPLSGAKDIVCFTSPYDL